MDRQRRGGRVRRPADTCFFTNESLTLNEHRDVVTLNLRGTGLAEPVLTCPEVTDLNIGAFAADIDETTPEGRAMRSTRSSGATTDSSVEGVDLSAYAADDARHDLEDLRIALGVEQWNIVAGEYGSKLAQILARDFPDSVRAVVVNSTPVPLQVDWFADLAPNAAQAWDRSPARVPPTPAPRGLPRSRRASRSPGGRPHRRPRSDDAVPLFDGRQRPVPHERQPTARVCPFLRCARGSSAVCR